MASLLGYFGRSCTASQNNYDFLKRLQPAVIKILDGGVPDYLWA